MAALPNRTGRKKISVMIMGDSRQRQLQVALYRMLQGYSKLHSMRPEDYCNRSELFNLRWENPIERDILHSCSFSKMMLPQRFEINRRWFPFLVNENIRQALHVLSGKSDVDLPDLVILGGGLHHLSRCWWYKRLAFNECLQIYVRYVLCLELGSNCTRTKPKSISIPSPCLVQAARCYVCKFVIQRAT